MLKAGSKNPWTFCVFPFSDVQFHMKGGDPMLEKALVCVPFMCLFWDMEGGNIEGLAILPEGLRPLSKVRIDEEISFCVGSRTPIEYSFTKSISERDAGEWSLTGWVGSWESQGGLRGSCGASPIQPVSMKVIQAAFSHEVKPEKGAIIPIEFDPTGLVKAHLTVP